MFGYVTINPESLSEAEKSRFKEVYCGVCRSLRLGEGKCGQWTLSFESAFLAMLLNALYEPEERKGAKRCTPHLTQKQPFATSEYTEYAADMNVLLFYFSTLDGWKDDRSHFKHALSMVFKKRANAVRQKYPRQATAIETRLRQLAEIEKNRLQDPDAACNCFGELLGEIFVYRQDEWEAYLRQMGVSMGRFIYLMDAWEDAEKDEKNLNYNPLISLKNQPDYEETVYSIMRLEIADCAMAFEKLPIVNDVNILRNILYSGVWTKYSHKRDSAQGKDKTV